MDTFGERTLCLLSPSNSSITASTFLPGSTSRGSRSRTRMGTSMERNFYTFILFSLALVILILSPSASANRCIPTFSLLSNGDGMEYVNNVSMIDGVRTHVTVREQASYKLNCSLNAYHSVKWTINSREITPQLQDEWDIDIESTEEMDGSLYTELRVNNASQKHHAGEYRCTPVCLKSVTSGANNIGVTVSINIAINVTISVVPPSPSKLTVGLDPSGNSIYIVNVQREKSIEIKCKAPVPNAQMTWFRIKDDKRSEENMADVCVGTDLELEHKNKRRTTLQHCSITHSSSGEETIITLHIKRARKEANEAIKTIADFRRYLCKAMKEGNQDGFATVDLVETIQAERKFVRGERSVSVIEGNELQIYCDIHGVEKGEFERGEAKLEWHKDGQKLVVEELKNIKRINEVGPQDVGRPYRIGFSYDMAEPHHRGQYKCELIRISDVDSLNGTKVTFDYYVRVKDKLGALWPFLGICAEVVILCTIILIYEKRRNKQELDESDTDGSPDQ